jgi:hypothetical protein
MGASVTPVTTIPWMENAPAAQATAMVPSQTVAPRLETDLPFERCRTRHGGWQAQARAQQPTAEQEVGPQ